jgi:hypothetical protein
MFLVKKILQVSKLFGIYLIFFFFFRVAIFFPFWKKYEIY